MATTTTVGRDGLRPRTGPRDAGRANHPSSRPTNKRQERRGKRLTRAVQERFVANEQRAQPLAFYVLALVVAILTLLGLVMVLSASSIAAIHREQSGWMYFQRQVIWALLGFGAFMLALKLRYDWWRSFFRIGLFASFILMLLTFVPGIGRTTNGARAWIDLGPVGFQPSEFMKLALLVYTADLLSRRADDMHRPARTLRPAMIVLTVACTLVMLQHDLGNAIAMAAIVFAVLFFAGTPLRPLAGYGGVMGGAAIASMFATAARKARWDAFIDLTANRDDIGYQVYQARIAIASGGLAGAGLGAGKAKWGFLPEAHTDFIFAVIGEEIGLLGVVVVCGLFIVLGYMGVQVALRCTDRFGMLLAGGITAWLLVQALINIGGVVGLMPLTGITLPFVSFGGTSLLTTMVAAGLLLNVARSNP